MRKVNIQTQEVVREIIVSEIIQCNKCGREFVNPLAKGSAMEQFMWDANVHGFKVMFSYGSKFDMQEWEFHLCDDCLEEIAKGFSVPVDVTHYSADR